MKLRNSINMLAAFADETRLRILSLLSEGELCVCDLMCVLKEPQSKVSRHLAYLRRAQLVWARKERLWMHYRLAKPVTKTQGALLQMVGRARAEVGALKKDLKELKRNKGCLVACCK